MDEVIARVNRNIFSLDKLQMKFSIRVMKHSDTKRTSKSSGEWRLSEIKIKTKRKISKKILHRENEA